MFLYSTPQTLYHRSILRNGDTLQEVNFQKPQFILQLGSFSMLTTSTRIENQNHQRMASQTKTSSAKNIQRRKDSKLKSFEVLLVVPKFLFFRVLYFTKIPNPSKYSISELLHVPLFNPTNLISYKYNPQWWLIHFKKSIFRNYNSFYNSNKFTQVESYSILTRPTSLLSTRIESQNHHRIHSQTKTSSAKRFNPEKIQRWSHLKFFW